MPNHSYTRPFQTPSDIAHFYLLQLQANIWKFVEFDYFSLYFNANAKLQLKIQMQLMEDESAQQFLSLCSPISTLILNQMNSNKQKIESQFMLARTSQNKYCILMGNHKIAFGKAIEGQNCYFGYLQMSFNLKFVKILQNERNIKSKIIGFTLLLSGLQISIYIQNQTYAAYWINQLSQKLNQKGFHQNFKPIRKIGKGGFATVYEVNRLSDNKRFAVKAFSKGKNQKNDQNFNLNSLINEIQLLRIVSSEQNLLQLFQVYESDNSIYAVFQLLEGGDLKSLMQQKAISFTSQQIKKCLYNLLKGIKSLHQHRIMHRDLKPDNILLRKRYQTCNYQFELTIGDFGLASFSDAQQYIYEKCGTPGYVAPQIIHMQPRQHIQPACDVFSLGVIFHLILCGRPLFGGKTFEQIYSNNKHMNFNLNDQFYSGIDSTAMDLLKKMLIQDPKERISAEMALSSEYLREIKTAQQNCKLIQTMLTPISLNLEHYQQEIFAEVKKNAFFNFNQNK